MTAGIVTAVVVFASVLYPARTAEICCPDIGCFTDDPPYEEIPLPWCIEDMTPHYYMFTRSNQAIGEEFDHLTVPSVFDGSRRSIFLHHGWNSDGDSSWLHSMKDTLLGVEDANFVIVDWGGGAQVLNYFQAASNTRSMGAYTALVADNLINNGGSETLTWIMGHSLGAHLSGHAGMRSAYTIDRVTGMDPAGPWFQGELDKTVGINQESGRFVDIIHTDTELGQLRDLGHVDFYPGGGANQPGCLRRSTAPEDDDPETSPQDNCSHGRAHDYMEISMTQDCFLAWDKCSNYEDIPGSCYACACGSDPCAHMGYPVVSSCQTSGWFYIAISPTSPYCVS